MQLSMGDPETAKTPFMRALPTAWHGGDVSGPDLRFGEFGAALRFGVQDGEGRVTFEKLDSVRISRGEHEPYDSDWDSQEVYPWVYVVENSPWLLERYGYEAKFYRTSYEFNGDVEEMLRDFDHYVFMFEDNFAEAIAAGIWFQVSEHELGDTEGFDDHPLKDLTEDCTRERLESSGITYQVRVNPRPMTELESDSRYCSQPLIHIATELEGRCRVDWRLSLRTRRGVQKSILRSNLGRVEKVFDGIAGFPEIRQTLEHWLAEVRRRRHEMGKD